MSNQYFVYPDAGDDLWMPTSPEPLTLKEAFQSISNFQLLMEKQGYWRDSSGRQVPSHQVRFIIEHEDYISNLL